MDSGEEHSRQREHSKSHVRGAANRLLTGREMVVRKEERVGKEARDTMKQAGLCSHLCKDLGFFSACDGSHNRYFFPLMYLCQRLTN